MNSQKAYAHAFSEHCGGVAASAAAAIANCGGDSYYIGRFGEDFIGSKIKKELGSQQVNIEHSLTYSQAQTSIATVVISEDSQSKIFVYNDPNMPKDASGIFSIELDKFDAVVADVTWSEGVKALFERAKKLGIPSFLRISFFDSTVEELAKLADYCIFNRPSLLVVSKEVDPRKGLRKASKKLGGHHVVTLGNYGAGWCYDGQYGEVKALDVNPVDTTAAGDIFLGIFAYAIAIGISIPSSTEVANIISGLSCEEKGTRLLNNREKAKLLIESLI